MYSKKEFAQKLKEALERRYPEAEIEQMTVAKNQRTLEGLVIKQPGQSAAPIFYVDDGYSTYQASGGNFPLAAAGFLHNVEKYIQLPEIFNEEQLLANWREKVIFTLVAADQTEYLKDKPHTIVLDMAKVYAIMIPEAEDFGFMAKAVVTKDGARSLGVSLDELDALATANTMRLYPPQFAWIMDRIAQEVLKRNPEMSEAERLQLAQTVFGVKQLPLLVITNEQQRDGAATMLYDHVLDVACEVLRTEDIFVLPSSRHEVIVAPQIGAPDGLLEIVDNINKRLLPPEDRLITQVYSYTKGQELEIADMGQEPEISM